MHTPTVEGWDDCETATCACLVYELPCDDFDTDAEERLFAAQRSAELAENSQTMRERHDAQARNVFRNAYLRHNSFKRTRARRRVF